MYLPASFFWAVVARPLIIFGIAIVWKIMQKNKFKAWLSELPRMNDIEITDITPYQLTKSRYYEAGVTGSVIGNSVHVSKNYIGVHTTYNACEFKIKNVTANTFAEVQFVCHEYDNKGLKNEERPIIFEVTDLRPNETKRLSAYAAKHRLMLDHIEIRLNKTTEVKEIAINKAIPKASYSIMPTWIFAVLMSILLFAGIRWSSSWGFSIFLALCCLMIASLGLKRIVTTIPVIIVMLASLWLFQYDVFTVGAIYLAIVWTRKKNLLDFFAFKWLQNT